MLRRGAGYIPADQLPSGVESVLLHVLNASVFYGFLTSIHEYVFS